MLLKISRSSLKMKVEMKYFNDMVSRIGSAVFLGSMFLGTTSSLASTLPVAITDLVTSANCASDSVEVEEVGGEYAIFAYFSDMTAIAETVLSDKKRCTISFNLEISPGYQLEAFDFSVDGSWMLSEQGTARLTVSHRAGNHPGVRFTEFFSAAQGGERFGDINEFIGSITSYELDPIYQSCGSHIPMRTSVYAQAIKPSLDQSGITMITLDEAVSNSEAIEISRVRVGHCQQP